MRQSSGEYGLLVLISTISVIGALGNFVVLTFLIRKQLASHHLSSGGGNSLNKKSGGIGSSSPMVGGANSQRLSTNMFILVLSANDFIASVLVMPLTLVYELSPQLLFTTDLACKFYYFITTSVIPFSAFLIIAISVDRYLCLCQPLRVVLTPLRTRIVVTTLGFISSVMGVLVAINFIVKPAETQEFMIPPPSFYMLRKSSNATRNSNNNSTFLIHKSMIDNETSSRGLTQTIRPPFSVKSLAVAANNNQGPASSNKMMLSRNITHSVKQFYNFTRAVGRGRPDANTMISSYDFPLVDDQQCLRVNVLGEAFSEVYSHLHNAIIFGLAFTVPFILYAIIYCRISERQRNKARRKSEQTRILAQNTSTKDNNNNNNGNKNGKLSSLKAMNSNNGTVVEPEPISLVCRDEYSETVEVSHALNNLNCEFDSVVETSFIENNNGNREEEQEKRASSGAVNDHLLSVPGSVKSVTIRSPNNNGKTPRRQRTASLTGNFRLLSSEKSVQIRLAAMLFVVTLVFALSYIPALISNYLSSGNSAWNRFVFYIYFVNNAANPIIYGIVNKQFRQEMLKSYFKC